MNIAHGHICQGKCRCRFDDYCTEGGSQLFGYVRGEKPRWKLGFVPEILDKTNYENIN